MENVTPIEKARTNGRSQAASESRHPAGKRIHNFQRCPDCGHTWGGHTEKAHDGEGGCAYCRCNRTSAQEP